MITISKVLDATSEFIKVLRYGLKDVNTPKQALPFGIDSKPVMNKRGIVLETKKKAENIIIGYIIKSELTEKGEIRLFATDSDNVEQNYIQLFNDGIIEIGGDEDNMVRYSELKAAFDELKSDFNTLVTAYNSHIHITTATVGATAVPGVLSPTTSSGSSSRADMSKSKIDEIKTSNPYV